MGNQDISFRMGMDTGPFSKALTSVQADVAGFSKNVTHSWRQAFTTAAILASIKSVGDSMVELRRKAEDLGASVTFVQTIERMAEKFGATAGEADTAMTKLAETVGMARTEGGEAEKKFAKFGISLYDVNLVAKSNEEIFKDIATAYKGSTDAATKAALAFEFFGRTGRSINNILAEGGAGIDDYTKKLESSLRIASPDRVNAVADAWLSVKTNVSGIGTNLLGGLIQGYGALKDLATGGIGKLRESRKERTDLRKSGERATKEKEDSDKLAANSKKQAENAKEIETIQKETARIKHDGMTDDEKLLDLDKDQVQLLEKIHSLQEGSVDRQRLELDFLKKKVEWNKIVEKQAEDDNKSLKEAQKAFREALKEREEYNKRGQSMLDDRARAVSAAKDARTDRSKFTLAELASLNIRGISDPSLRADAMAAQQASDLIQQGEFLKYRGRVGDIAASQAAFSKADKLRAGIKSLTDAERFPFQSLDAGISSIDDQMAEFLELAGEKGIIVNPKFGK